MQLGNQSMGALVHMYEHSLIGLLSQLWDAIVFVYCVTITSTMIVHLYNPCRSASAIQSRFGSKISIGIKNTKKHLMVIQ